MQQIWKCDFCTETGSFTTIAIHEGKCSFNPANKKCWSCANRVAEKEPGCGFTLGCSWGVEFIAQDDVLYGGKSCAFWVPES